MCINLNNNQLWNYRKHSVNKLSSKWVCRVQAALVRPTQSLLLAYGLVKDWDKIAVIDSENHSADLYAHLGDYSVVTIGPPFSPAKYIEAIELCEAAGMEVIIIDSISHEWDGAGGILDYHSSLMGNSFTNWSKVTPMHNSFVNKILQSPAHIIATIRSKQDYVLSERNGKVVPEKVGSQRSNPGWDGLRAYHRV